MLSTSLFLLLMLINRLIRQSKQSHSSLCYIYEDLILIRTNLENFATEETVSEDVHCIRVNTQIQFSVRKVIAFLRHLKGADAEAEAEVFHCFKELLNSFSHVGSFHLVNQLV